MHAGWICSFCLGGCAGVEVTGRAVLLPEQGQGTRGTWSGGRSPCHGLGMRSSSSVIISGFMIQQVPVSAAPGMLPDGSAIRYQ